jgi:hypothetical protein
MKFFFFEIHYQKCFIHLILISICRVITDIITTKKQGYFQHSIILREIIMFLSQTLAIFVYLYQKHIMKDINKKNKMFKIFYLNIKKSFFWFLSIILYCSICIIFGYMRFDLFFYNNDMKKIPNELITNFEFIFLFIYLFFLNKYYLGFEIHRHHIIGLTLNIIGILFYLVIEIFRNNNFNPTFSFLYVLIIIIEAQFLQSLTYTFPKKLNHQYFMNMNLILFFEGLFGIIILITYDFFYVYIFKFEDIFIFKIQKEEEQNYFIDIIYIFSYLIFNGTLNILNYIVIEETSPIYMTVAKGLSNIFTYISQIIQYSLLNNNQYKEINSYQNIVFLFLSLIGFSIFLELITLNFSDLDKYTKEKTASRGENDTILELTRNSISDEE